MDKISYEDVLGWLLLIYVIGGFLYSCYRSESYNLTRYFLQALKTQPSWISSLLYYGGACVIGTPSGESIKSPISGKQCVFWGIEVQDLRWFTWNPRISRKNWKKLYRATSNNLFEICDDTGKIWVDPQDGYFIGGGFQYFDETTLKNFTKSGVYSGDLSNFAQFREYVIASDTPFCVWGAITVDGAKKILRTTKKIHLLMSKNDRRSSISDLFYDLINEMGPYFLLLVFPVIIFFLIAISGTILIKILPPFLFILFIFFVFFLGGLADKRNDSE